MVDNVPSGKRQLDTVAPPKPQTVQTTSLRPNPHNPRVLFDEEPLKVLEGSIRKVGILVPLTVYQATGSKKHTILDGQRRWICAKRIGLSNVPINIVTEPSLAQNIVTMFQIHKLRKDWELMPTALKLGVLMRELEEKNDSALANLTGLDSAVVVRCKKLLSFEKSYQELMLDRDPENRLKADLFIEMYPIVTDRTVIKAQWFDRIVMIDALMRKYQHKLSSFKSVTDFRKVKAALTNARRSAAQDEILEKLKRFVSDDTMSISDLEVQSGIVRKEAAELTRTVQRLSTQVQELDTDLFVAEEDLWIAMEKLLVAIRKTLASAERRPV